MRNTKLRFSDAKGVNSKGKESATRRYKLKGIQTFQSGYKGNLDSY